MVEIPLQGQVGVFNPKQPTLLPNFDPQVVDASGQTADGPTVGAVNPATYLSNNPRAAATDTATLSGTITNGDSFVLTLTHVFFSGGSLSKTIAVVSADSLATLAEKAAKAFNDDAQCQALDVEVDAGGASGAVLTFNWPGPIGNLAVLSATSGSAVTVTVAASGVFSGGTGPIIPTQNFQWHRDGSTSNFRYGIPVFIDPYTISLLVAQGQPIV